MGAVANIQSKGHKLLFRGEFTRMPRVSLLCFVDCDGLVETFMTEGTFDRQTFFRSCREFALSGNVQQYPGRRSVWILDGARIHCHRSITYYLRSIGIIPVYLPAYCPFFNPIEIFFGIVKKHMQRHYRESKVSPKNLPIFISTCLKAYTKYSLRKVFTHCGYSLSGLFNPGTAFSDESSYQALGFEIVSASE